MEINIENAFTIFMKITLRPFFKSFDGLSQKIETISDRILVAFLERPRASTMLLTCWMIMIVSVLTVSIIVFIAVLCMVIIIFIVEGFIFGVVLILTAVITIQALGLMILLLG